jgi:hypothetical protein
MFLGHAVHLMPAEQLWQDVISGKIRARVYAVGETDFGPVPISPLALQGYDKAEVLKSFQIEFVDRDVRRPARRRRRIPVPHWIYVVRDDLPARKVHEGPGRPEDYDWDDIYQFVCKEFQARGDLQRSENRVKGWRSQNDVIELIKNYLQRRKQRIPGDTQLKKRVSEILKRIRSELPTDH